MLLFTQGMASSGHIITLVGIVFFFLMLLDSHIEHKVVIYKHLGIPRWHKRIQYYTYKIRLLQLNNKKFNKFSNLDLKKQLITRNTFN